MSAGDGTLRAGAVATEWQTGDGNRLHTTLSLRPSRLAIVLKLGQKKSCRTKPLVSDRSIQSHTRLGQHCWLTEAVMPTKANRNTSHNTIARQMNGL